MAAGQLYFKSGVTNKLYYRTTSDVEREINLNSYTGVTIPSGAIVAQSSGLRFLAKPPGATANSMQATGYSLVTTVSGKSDGTIWVEGNYFHYIVYGGREYRILGS